MGKGGMDLTERDREGRFNRMGKGGMDLTKWERKVGVYRKGEGVGVDGNGEVD